MPISFREALNEFRYDLLEDPYRNKLPYLSMYRLDRTFHQNKNKISQADQNEWKRLYAYYVRLERKRGLQENARRLKAAKTIQKAYRARMEKKKAQTAYSASVRRTNAARANLNKAKRNLSKALSKR